MEDKNQSFDKLSFHSSSSIVPKQDSSSVLEKSLPVATNGSHLSKPNEVEATHVTLLPEREEDVSEEKEKDVIKVTKEEELKRVKEEVKNQEMEEEVKEEVKNQEVKDQGVEEEVKDQGVKEEVKEVEEEAKDQEVKEDNEKEEVKEEKDGEQKNENNEKQMKEEPQPSLRPAVKLEEGKEVEEKAKIQRREMERLQKNEKKEDAAKFVVSVNTTLLQVQESSQFTYPSSATHYSLVMVFSTDSPVCLMIYILL